MNRVYIGNLSNESIGIHTKYPLSQMRNCRLSKKLRSAKYDQHCQNAKKRDWRQIVVSMTGFHTIPTMKSFVHKDKKM